MAVVQRGLEVDSGPRDGKLPEAVSLFFHFHIPRSGSGAWSVPAAALRARSRCSQAVRRTSPEMDSGSEATLSTGGLICGVCSNLLRRPKLLPCLHSICLECLENVWAGKNLATCPICSAPADRDVTKIQDNAFLANLLSKHQLWQRIGAGLGICCDLCQACGIDEPATSLCFQCDQFLCLRCYHSHQLLTEKLGHLVKLLDNLKVLSYEEFLTLVWNEKQIVCPMHTDQQISFFCKTCSTSICCNCLLLHHIPQGHSYHDVKQQAVLEGEILNQMMETVRENYSQFTDSCSELMSLKERMNLMRSEIEASIKQQASAVMQEIIDEGDRLLKEVEAVHNVEQSRLVNNLTQIVQTVKRMGAGDKLASAILKLGTNEEMVEMYEPIRSALTALEQAKPFDMSSDVTVMEFQECTLEAKTLLGILTHKEEQREGAGDPEIEKSVQEALVNRVPKGLEESTMGGQQQTWKTEHNYYVSVRHPSLPLPDSTQQITLDVSSDETQLSSSEEKTNLSSDDSKSDGASLMIPSVPLHPESSEAPWDQGENNGSGQMNKDWVQEGSWRPWQCQELRGFPVVFFQIQTTDVGDGNIVQLSAVSGEKIFNKYILPRKPTVAHVPIQNGLHAVDGILYLQGEAQPTCGLNEALESFLCFLRQLDLPLLAGHGIWTLDCQTLCKAFEALSMKDCLAQCMSGFLDTLWLAKKVLSKSEVRNFTLKYLVRALVSDRAIPNVQALQKLYSILKPSRQQAEECEFTLAQLECRCSLEPLIQQEVISSLVADRLAFEGVSLSILEFAYRSDQKSGLRNLVQASRNLGLRNPWKITRAIRSFLKGQMCK
ncbi:protein PML-like [Narcine bancroftii]|uniref:protein PML-like n=1 Tax=Narcine bancroftii TaxID=1343680 RepID=UPI0038312998